MKIQCDVCERAEAAVLCCADEAALCWRCDESVHAANKLAGKHQRVPLLPRVGLASSSSSPSTPNPTCDICQEKAGYFFCLEDRALLCRQCDVSVHTASPYVSTHQRFLITGVRVAPQQCLINNDNNNNNTNNSNNSSSSNGNSSNSNGNSNKIITRDNGFNMWLDPTVGYLGEETESLKPQWPWNEIIGNAGFDQCYGLSEPGSSSLSNSKSSF